MSSPTAAAAITYSQFACIGTGISAIGLGATLQRWHGITDIQFFERHDQLGGTWYINRYPGCACDVPSVLYSLSYEPNAGWTRVLPSSTEIYAYMRRVASKYKLIQRMKFSTEVQSCVWQEDRSRWRITARNLKTRDHLVHECQVLFAATGALVYPRDLGVPGVENFKGAIFHSAQWKPDVDLKGKDVVIFGNGCTANQIVPAIVEKTKTLTQVVRSKHWIFPAIDREYPRWMQLMFKYVPFTQWLHRFHIFVLTEREFRLFPMTESAARLRASHRKGVEKYMREAAPKRFHAMLIPDFDVGCKRRIFDSGYLKSMHSPQFDLTMDPAREILAHGVRTDRGVINADVIIMANGFRTNDFVDPIAVTGRDGETLTKHWTRFGGAEAYNSTSLNKFPNFFMILGPNAVTGHTSALMASENSVNYSLRILKPVIEGKAEYVEVKAEAEAKYAFDIQKSLKNTVWSSGCDSWYIRKYKDSEVEWNAMAYPYSQARFWRQSLFPKWSDWLVNGKETSVSRNRNGLPLLLLIFLAAALCLQNKYGSLN